MRSFGARLAVGSVRGRVGVVVAPPRVTVPCAPRLSMSTATSAATSAVLTGKGLAKVGTTGRSTTVSLATAAAAAAAAAVAAATAATQCDGTKSKESATGIEFEGAIDEAELCGVGCRYKFGIVKVYAVGLYSAVPTPLPDTSSDVEVCRAVLDSTLPKAVVLKMARGLDSKSLVGALEDAFKPRLSKEGRSMAGWSDFQDCILQQTGSRCDPGDEFYFCCQGDRLSVTLKRGGKMFVSESVTDKDICWALFDTYLGVEVPEVSPSLKKDVVKHYRKA